MSIEQTSQNPSVKPRVAIVFGGRSSEHAISVSTAGSVLRAIDRDKYEVLPIGITHEGRWALVSDEPARMTITDGRLPDVDQVAESVEGQVALPLGPGSREVVWSEPGAAPKALGEVDVVFPLLHGPWGEDGTLQGLLELSGVPYVGNGVLSSAVGMDKEFTKRLLASHGLGVGRYTVVRPREWETEEGRAAVRERAAELGLPLFVKPCRAGSSMGITKVKDLSDLDRAIDEARRHDPKLIIEAGVSGREIECAVLEFEDGPRASVPAEVLVGGDYEFYDFEAKYIDSSEVRIPAELSGEETAEIRRQAVAAFEALGCEGLARVDFFLLEDGSWMVNEINTMPGFTPISAYPKMWEASGLSYPELIDRLLQAALRRSTGLR
ncbi:MULTISPECIES: D-alanine--D-alanine ligase family protein [unclassified Streptomyces]|uniref:D-alanine--D-alanine ligase family protein n=1 Tax=Streptomycetaceae TaxID=2062 RepID=UPI002E78411D|nr:MULTISPECIES: D-alanine--D-alanine ligase family protein [unclassified Streptomyces]MED7953566.1 D-alanine--D-alanine ligase [Streptomyces sp. BE303]MEE1826647.1 D-alanine--D-alanine ligase [Streptomyces sp. BE20]